MRTDAANADRLHCSYRNNNSDRGRRNVCMYASMCVGVSCESKSKKAFCGAPMGPRYAPSTPPLPPQPTSNKANNRHACVWVYVSQNTNNGLLRATALYTLTLTPTRCTKRLNQFNYQQNKAHDSDNDNDNDNETSLTTHICTNTHTLTCEHIQINTQLSVRVAVCACDCGSISYHQKPIPAHSSQLQPFALIHLCAKHNHEEGLKGSRDRPIK